MFSKGSLYKIGTALIFVLVFLTFGIQFSDAHSGYDIKTGVDVPEPHHHHDKFDNEGKVVGKHEGHEHGLYEAHTHVGNKNDGFPAVGRKVASNAEVGTYIGAPVTRSLAVPLSHGRKHTLVPVLLIDGKSKRNIKGVSRTFASDVDLFDVSVTTGQLVTKQSLSGRNYYVFVDVSLPNHVRHAANPWSSILVVITVENKYAPKFVERPILSGSEIVQRDWVDRWVNRGATTNTHFGDPLFAIPYENLTYTLNTQTNRRTDDDRIFDIDHLGQLKTGSGFRSYFTQGAGKDERAFPLTVTVSREGYTDEIEVVVDIHGDSSTTGGEGRSRYLEGRQVVPNSDGMVFKGLPAAKIDFHSAFPTGKYKYTLSGLDADAFHILNRQLIPNYNLELLPTHYEVIVEVNQQKPTIYIYYTNANLMGTSPTISGATRGDIGVAVENSAPEFTEGATATRSVAENTKTRTKIGDPVSATDADDDTLKYRLGGTDANQFRISGKTGQLRTRKKLDYETKSTYSVTVTASDGHGGKATIDVTINVTDVNEDAAEAPAVGARATETALLANYPNLFNPETWLPYQLAVPADVTLTVYDMSGGMVRRLALGHQAAGVYYSRSRAAYWDGKNESGEKVATGVYFYTLTAGEFTATRKMLIRK
ncbi:MAG: cadherin domain-containing protein [Candidatus Poribacteria bacterium]|nr:cadherin domain-containing protein [Candidatus Poribacteria bacterium]